MNNKLLIHIGIATVLFISFELHIRSLRNDYVIKGEYFSKARDTLETLIVGSSVALRGLDPEIIGFKAFNYAFQSQSHDVDLAILSEVLPGTPNLERIVIPVSALSLKNDLSNTQDTFIASNYCLFTNFNLGVPFLHHLASTNFLYYRDMAKAAFFDAAAIAKVKANGFSPFIAEWDSIHFTKKALEQRHSRSAQKTALPESLGLSNLSKIISLCSEQGIEAILLETPIAPSFRAYSGLSAMDEASKRAIGHLASVPGITYVEVPADYFSDQDFHDPTHLNITGAQKWSRLVRERIVSLQPH